ncbi:MAG TPA: HYR domain-containing protein, partial [Prolixibacteraceae bacterium]
MRFFTILSPILILAATAGQSFGGNALALTLTTNNVTCNGQSNGTITSDNPSIILGSVAAFCPGAPSFSLDCSAASGSPVSYSISAGTPAMTGFISVVDTLLGASPLTIPLPAGVPKGTYQFIITVKNAAGSPSVAQTFSLNFDDITKPIFTAPGAITVFKDLSCNVNISPAITGDVVILSDNFTPAANLVITHVDGAPVPVGGNCNLPYTITRTWRVTDSAGNYDEKTQLITVNDNIQPNLTLPPDIALSCEQSILPDVTGTATATDNCSPTTISSVDSQVFGSCGGNSVITRTWTAKDCSGNTVSGDQRITVTDNTKPVASIPNKPVSCPADIPAPYADLTAFIAGGGTATDNCGALILTLFNEISNGLDGKPGYCPTSVTRVYRISDPCGNYTDVPQTISVSEECGCSKCDAGTNFHSIDLLGKPTGSVTITQQQRNGACCIESNCISFNVQLDIDAIGVEILVGGATPSPQDWRIDCNSVAISGNLVCLPGGSFHLFTYCKPGDDKNDFTFRSVPGIIGSGNITTRVECNGQLLASGFTDNPTWKSISPGVIGQYNSYLSNISVANPTFTADINSPPVIQYEVSGKIGTILCALGRDSAVATVNVMQKIGLTWNTNPAMVCLGNMPTLTANVSPVANYTYDWYNGHDATGTIIYSGSASYKPSVAGPYSLKVTDISSGITCNSAIFPFDVTIDNIGPTVLAPTQPLFVQCGDPAASQQITNWLATASASYTKPDGTVFNFVPSNNFAGITMACNDSLNVTFSAADQCGNESTTTSTIKVTDTQPPVITTQPRNGSSDCVSVDPNLDAGYLAWLANHGGATATDVCAANLTWTDNRGTQSWIINAIAHTRTISVKFTATDDCGNSIQTLAATYTLNDNLPPTIACPGNVTENIAADQCSKTNVIIGSLTYSDNCSIPLLNWELTGATSGSGSGLILPSQAFNVGKTKVTYTVTDDTGLATSCSFEVWIKRSDIPPTVITCPANPAPAVAEAGICTAPVTVASPVINDPCNSIVSVVNSFNNTNNASGNYPVGTKTVTWTITDNSGNINTS